VAVLTAVILALSTANPCESETRPLIAAASVCENPGTEWNGNSSDNKIVMVSRCEACMCAPVLRDVLDLNAREEADLYLAEGNVSSDSEDRKNLWMIWVPSQVGVEQPLSAGRSGVPNRFSGNE
jgi:hypothetical protein